MTDEDEVASRANIILTFWDERGREYLCAAEAGPLCRFDRGEVAERLEVETLKDRAFLLKQIKVVHRDGV